LSSARKKAQVAKFASEMKELQKAIISYKIDNGGLLTPADSTFVTYSDAGGFSGLDTLSTKLVDGDYIPEIPHFPGWNSTNGADVTTKVHTIGDEYSQGTGDYDIGFICDTSDDRNVTNTLSSGIEGGIFFTVDDPDITLPFVDISNLTRGSYCVGGNYVGCLDDSNSNQFDYCLPF